MNKILVSSAFAGMLNATAALSLDGSAIAVIAAVVATVTLTITVVAWIDKRIEHKIQNQTHKERWRYTLLLREVSNLRELMGHPPLNVSRLMEAEEKEG